MTEFLFLAFYKILRSLLDFLLKLRIVSRGMLISALSYSVDVSCICVWRDVASGFIFLFATDGIVLFFGMKIRLLLPKQVSALHVLRHNRWYLCTSRVKVFNVIWFVEHWCQRAFCMFFVLFMMPKRFFLSCGKLVMFLMSKSRPSALERINLPWWCCSLLCHIRMPDPSGPLPSQKMEGWAGTQCVFAVAGTHKHTALDCTRRLFWIYSCMF